MNQSENMSRWIWFILFIMKALVLNSVLKKIPWIQLIKHRYSTGRSFLVREGTVKAPFWMTHHGRLFFLLKGFKYSVWVCGTTGKTFSAYHNFDLRKHLRIRIKGSFWLWIIKMIKSEFHKMPPTIIQIFLFNYLI